MAAEAEQVDAERRRLQGDVAHGLGGIAVETDASLAAEGADGRQRLQHTDLVVGGHHAHQQRVGPQGRFQHRRLQQAIGPHRQHGERKAMPFEVPQWIEHRAVFRGHGDQMPPPAAGLELGLR